MTRTPKIERPHGAFSHRFDMRVRFGDTDAAGIVYYANYYRFFEAGRAELMREAGLGYVALTEGDDTVLPVVESWCRNRAPAFYDDLLTVETWVQEIRSATILVGTMVSRGEEIIAEGGVRLGCMDRQGRPRRLPDGIRAFDWRLPPPTGPS